MEHSQSRSSSDESASPNLSSSPLQNIGGTLSSALPSAASPDPNSSQPSPHHHVNGYSRDDSYGSSTAASSEPADLAPEDDFNDEESEALKRYKEQMHSYIASRFASFKYDLERKSRAEGTSLPPSGLPQRRNH